ncbi:MAG: hypothetical protein MUW56_01475 [Chryseobacterium sp.]|uniref:hypothetical protein n=1 Tax=Chryseobacterium sp. TaxID=1871047 RepID=UPI0025C01C80|nr:hypothetical protein [Chryseobacterium sp.]MCJ7932323.1 hypothetical protein [Chryseobacterium sp.]
MKNLFLPFIAISFVVLACKKNNTEKNIAPADSANTQSSYSDTAASASRTSSDSMAGHDSINTKTHIGGRKTSNNNTGNSTGNINAAVSDSAHPAR